jgi:hypothetical protein
MTLAVETQTNHQSEAASFSEHVSRLGALYGLRKAPKDRMIRDRRSEWNRP